MSSGKAAPRTIQKRSHSLASVRFAVSAGDDTTQLAHEVNNCSQKERRKLIQIRRAEGGFRISVEQAVSGTESGPRYPLKQVMNNKLIMRR